MTTPLIHTYPLAEDTVVPFRSEGKLVPYERTKREVRDYSPPGYTNLWCMWYVTHQVRLYL